MTYHFNDRQNHIHKDERKHHGLLTYPNFVFVLQYLGKGAENVHMQVSYFLVRTLM